MCSCWIRVSLAELFSFCLEIIHRSSAKKFIKFCNEYKNNVIYKRTFKKEKGGDRYSDRRYFSKVRANGFQVSEKLVWK